MFQEFGQKGNLIIATDGSFTPRIMKADWVFAAFLDRTLITEKSGVCTLCTNSTRMKFEAVKQALGWLVRENPDVTTVVFATDSMVRRIQSGWLPDGRREAAPYLHNKSPTFV
ncbi:uncharacterized protein LOC143257184 [Tachypleus tridentatus]|uniref:uncharacterized protein LOC143257184 n=1 Tax=Tachypleus tridentatus TaxID=6853 RepID=UPI003FD4402E